MTITKENIIKVYAILRDIPTESAGEMFNENVETIETDYPEVTDPDKKLEFVLWNMCNLSPEDMEDILTNGVPEEEVKPDTRPDYIKMFFAEKDRVWEKLIKETLPDRRVELCNRYAYLEERCSIIKSAKKKDLPDWNAWCGVQLGYLDQFGNTIKA